MEVAVKTHVGHVRQVNEDYAEVVENEGLLLAILADGMGGHLAGDVASKMAIKTIKEAFLKSEAEKNRLEWGEWLRETLIETNRSLYQYALNNIACSGMGTTVVALLIGPDYYIVAHVGDSRLYRFSDDEGSLVTQDHSLVNELLQRGQITEEEAHQHPQRNIITRALGTEETIEIDLETYAYTDEKYFLLCSDGLSNYVHREEMKGIITSNLEVEEKADKLLQKALDSGGDDNITLILIKLDGESL